MGLTLGGWLREAGLLELKLVLSSVQLPLPRPSSHPSGPSYCTHPCYCLRVCLLALPQWQPPTAPLSPHPARQRHLRPRKNRHWAWLSRICCRSACGFCARPQRAAAAQGSGRRAWWLATTMGALAVGRCCIGRGAGWRGCPEGRQLQCACPPACSRCQRVHQPASPRPAPPPAPALYTPSCQVCASCETFAFALTMGPRTAILTLPCLTTPRCTPPCMQQVCHRL